jgi:hypothetical protein
MNKAIWIYWAQGWDAAPELIKQCKRSWEYYNTGWNIHFLDDSNLTDYFDIDSWIPNLQQKDIGLSAKSDIIRINLLRKYGGVWADATLWCHKPLDDWLQEYMLNDFFTFSNPTDDRAIGPWFIAADKSGYMIDAYYEIVKKYWIEHDCAHNYFWTHGLFNNLYETDMTFKALWDDVPKIECPIDGDKNQPNQPHFFVQIWRAKKQRWWKRTGPKEGRNFMAMVNSHQCPVYKLSHHRKGLETLDKIKYLFNTIKKP